MISYHPSSWPFQLRDDLIQAGCNEKVALVTAKAFGELIDHVTAQRKDAERALGSRDLDRQMSEASIERAKDAATEKLLSIGIIVLAISLVAGIVLALFR